MGYQEREQKVFQGLYDTRQGTGAPGWAAEDVVNIDFRRQSIRGRAPTSRIWTDALPSQGTWHDGQKVVCATDFDADVFCLETLSSDTDTGFVVRAYVSGLNLPRLAKEEVWASTSDYWFICGSTGDSTSQALTDGWMISLEQSAADTFRFRLDVRVEATGGGSPADDPITVALVTADTLETDTFCIEWRWDPAHTTHKLSYFKNGDNASPVDASSSLSSQKILRDGSADYYLTVGAFEYPDNRQNLLYNFDGTIGQVEIHKIDDSDTEAETRWLSYAEGDIPTRVYFLNQPRGTDYTWGVLGSQAAYTNTGDGNMELFPRSSYLDSNEVIMPPGNTGYITAVNTDLEGIKVWGWILGVTVNAPAAGDVDFTFPPWIITDEMNNFVVTVSAGTDPTTQFKLNIAVAMFEKRDATDPDTVASALSLQTGNITYGTYTRLAFFLQSTPGDYGVLTASTLRAFTSPGGGAVDSYTQVGSGVSSPYLHNVESMEATLGGYDGDPRSIYFQLKDVRGYTGLEAIPTDSASVLAIDVEPGGTSYPSGLAVSLDGTQDVATTAVSGKNAIQRWRDSRNDYVFALFPNVKGRRWFGGVGSMTGPLHSPVLGVHDFNIQAGMEQTIQTAVILPGGVYVRDMAAGTGQFYPAPMYGIPDATSAVQYNDRLIITGNGMRPFKVYPGGTDMVGLQRPLVGILLETGSDADGDLASSTTYKYKFSLYNSLTGDESNLNPTGEEATTGGSDDTMSLEVGIISKTNSDWDFLMVYRQAQDSSTYYLEQRVPKPTYWQNTLVAADAPLTVVSTLRETELLLQQTESIDNYPPGDFSTSAIGGRVMHFGGAGTNPGYVFYSKTLLPQSAPPTNVWQLNNDNSDRVMVIRPLFGRVIILKQRSIWTARDDAAASGEQPANVHVGKGCVSPKAVAVAGNSLFFLSPDRVVYVTDGFEVSDVSSQSILGTLEVLTEDQLAGAQMTHDAPDQRIWLSIPPAGEGNRKLIYTFDYRLGRWSKWEVPHDVIDSGQDSAGLGQQRPIIGSRGSVYDMGTSFLNQESDAGSGQSDFSNTYPAADYILVDSKCAGFSSTFSWHESVIGMPCMVVFHSSSSYTETDDPLWDATRLYTYVRGVTVSGGDTNIYLGHSFTTSGTHATLLVGTQFRRYLNHWFSPQGVGFDYLFSGWTFVPDQDVVAANNDCVFRVWFDDESTPTYARGASEYASSDLVPDLSYSMRRRGRRLRYEILEGRTRGKEMDYQRAIIRYRIRGPRRRK
jgi:hypothetical protein